MCCCDSIPKTPIVFAVVVSLRIRIHPIFDILCHLPHCVMAFETMLLMNPTFVFLSVSPSKFTFEFYLISISVVFMFNSIQLNNSTSKYFALTFLLSLRFQLLHCHCSFFPHVLLPVCCLRQVFLFHGFNSIRFHKIK